MTILNHLVCPSSIFVSCTCDHPPPSMLPFLCNVTLKPHDAPPASIEPTTRLMSPWFCDVRLGFRPTRSTLEVLVKSPSHGPTELFARGRCRCLGWPGPPGEPQSVPCSFRHPRRSFGSPRRCVPSHAGGLTGAGSPAAFDVGGMLGECWGDVGGILGGILGGCWRPCRLPPLPVSPPSERYIVKLHSVVTNALWIFTPVPVHLRFAVHTFSGVLPARKCADIPVPVSSLRPVFSALPLQ